VDNPCKNAGRRITSGNLRHRESREGAERKLGTVTDEELGDREANEKTCLLFPCLRKVSHDGRHVRPVLLVRLLSYFKYRTRNCHALRWPSHKYVTVCRDYDRFLVFHVSEFPETWKPLPVETRK
jgi:hypothetical protein